MDAEIEMLREARWMSQSKRLMNAVLRQRCEVDLNLNLGQRIAQIVNIPWPMFGGKEIRINRAPYLRSYQSGIGSGQQNFALGGLGEGGAR